jgi:hypothetical protein
VISSEDVKYVHWFGVSGGCLETGKVVWVEMSEGK